MLRYFLGGFRSRLFPKPPITRAVKRRAILVAAAADMLQIALLPALFPGFVADQIIDLIVALVLIAAVGFQWRLALVFLFELIPVLGVLPTWTLVVLSLPTAEEFQTAAPPAEPYRVETLPRNP